MALSTTSGADVHYSNHDTSAPSHIDTNHLTWTPAHEARLALVQAQLSAAQARWSEEQELWLGEVQGLEELRRAHKKAAKKEAKRLAKKTAGIWKAKANISPLSAEASEEEGDEGEGNTKAREESQEISQSSFGHAMRRMSTTRSRRSTFTEGESSNASRRASVIERMLYSNPSALGESLDVGAREEAKELNHHKTRSA